MCKYIKGKIDENNLGLFSLTILMPFSLLAEKGKWKIEKSDQYCWIGSLAIDVIYQTKKEVIIMCCLQKSSNPETIVQWAGYDYKIGENIQVQIDKGIYNFYTLKTFKRCMDRRR